MTTGVTRVEFDKLCKQVDDLRSAQSSKPASAVKRTRKPSEFNLYVGDQIRGLKVKDPKLTHREAFSKAVENWNKSKVKK